MLEAHLRTLVLDYVCEGMIPQHLTRVTAIDFDDRGIHLTYSITPSLDRLTKRAGKRPVIFWEWSASDDRGNEYEACGGGFGPSPNGDSTNGVLSLRPLPPNDAHRLHVVLSPWLVAELEMTTSACEFDVDLTASRN